MSPVMELPAPTVEEMEADDFDPLPMLGPARHGAQVLPYRLAIPRGNRIYRATWAIERDTQVDGCFVRYTTGLPPHFVPLTHGFTGWMIDGDEMTIDYTVADWGKRP